MTAELWNNVRDVFVAMSEELNSNISGGDAQTQTVAKNYTDKAISEIPTPDVSGQIERHNTSPTAHPDIRELLNTCVGLPEFNDKTYELTFTTKGGAKFIIDLPIEMMGLHYNEDTQSIEFVNADGSISSIPVSDFPAQQHRILGQVDTCIAGDDPGQGRPHGASLETVRTGK